LATRRAVLRAETDPFAHIDQRDTIRRALSQVPVDQRKALVLLDWVGLTDTAAAEIMGISPEAARMRASRARQRLRELLIGGEGDD
jgi:RNA polymerase sigma-70 factor (ECF subfamily)